MTGDHVGGGLSHLCCLIEDSPSHFNLQEMELNRDKESEILIYLSKVLREIQGCIDGRGGCFSSKDLEEPAEDGRHFDLYQENLKVFNLMSFLTIKSKYIQHLVGNIFIATSQLVGTSESSWGEFVNLLCVCLEVAIFNALSNTSASLVKENESLNIHHQGSELIRHILENADWQTAAEIIRILRGIVKGLKNEEEEGPAKAITSSLRLSFLKLHWKLLSETCFHGKAAAQTTTRQNSGETESRVLFWGNLLQLFCSLVELDVSEESSPGPQNEHPMLHMVNGILPEISKSCLDHKESCHDTDILPYFRHKLLALLMRLSSQLPCNCDSVSSWLRILHSYYEDQLMEPISRPYHAHDDCLEGSPFLLSLCDQEICPPSSLHLKRKTIFLFLRCWLSLIDQRVSSDSNCACVRLDAVSDSNKVQGCSGRQRGILEFNRWLEVHVPFTWIIDSKAYMENCISFASSFIRLYIHEDDMLFEVLLQLFSIVTCTNGQNLKEDNYFDEVNQDAFCHIANVFNPLLLFHIFLSEIKYDHHLLLDYLISKDLGIRFAEYLLRCLRRVCDYWQEFVDIPVKERVCVPKSHKKRKSSLEWPHSYKDSVPTALHTNIASSNTELANANGQETMNCGRESLQIMKANTCLLSLKDSLIKLQRKNLFPYNPEVLLRRLKRFEELCSQ